MVVILKKNIFIILVSILFISLKLNCYADLPPALSLKIPSVNESDTNTSLNASPGDVQSPVSQPVREELLNLDQKLKAINLECKNKRQALKDALSVETKAALNERQKELVNKTSPLKK